MTNAMYQAWQNAIEQGPNVLETLTQGLEAACRELRDPKAEQPVGGFNLEAASYIEEVFGL